MSYKDLRVQKTLKNIQSSFFELLEEKPLKKITIKELSEVSKINKGTFYLHYRDIYDLYESVVNQFLDETIDELNIDFLFNDESINFLHSFHEITLDNMHKMLILRQEEYNEFIEELFIKKLMETSFKSQNIKFNETNRMKIEIIYKNILYLLPKADSYGQEKLIIVLSQLIDLIILQIQSTDVEV